MPRFIFKKEKYWEEIHKEYTRITEICKCKGELFQIPTGNITEKIIQT